MMYLKLSFAFLGVVFLMFQDVGAQDNTGLEYILIFDDVSEINASYSFSQGLQSERGGRLEYAGSTVQGPESLEMAKFVWNEQTDPPETDAIKRITGARYAEINQIVELDRVNWNDAKADSQWYLETIQLREAHHITTGSEDVIIALVDTGVDFDHEDLEGQFYRNPGESANSNDDDGNGYVDDLYGWNFVNNTPDASDDEGHGTAMAGIIAAKTNNNLGVVGIAPGTRIMPLKAFGEDGRGSLFDVIRAVLYAVENGAQIINMSYGYDTESTIERLMTEYAASRGVTMITSAGNVGGPNRRFPAAYDDVIAVAWTSESDRIASQASYGPHVALAAPGTRLYTTQYDPENGEKYSTVTGSSASSALVTGIAGLMLSMEPELTPNQIRSRLQSSADDIMNEGWDNLTGGGRVNAWRALMNEQHAFTKLDSVRLDGADVVFYGSVYHPSMVEYTVNIAQGVREDLSFQTLYRGTQNVLHGEIARVESDNVPHAERVYQTLSIQAETKTGQTFEHRKSFYFTMDNPETEHYFSSSGFSEDRRIMASYWLSEYPVQVISERDINGEISHYQNESRSTEHMVRYPLQQSGNFTEELIFTHPYMNLADTLKREVTLDAPLVSLLHLPTREYQQATQRVYAFNDERWPELDDYFFLQPVSNQTESIRLYEFSGDEPEHIENPIIAHGVLRSVDDFTGSGYPDLLAQAGNSFGIYSSDNGLFTFAHISHLEETFFDGWGIGFADVSGDGITEAWAHINNELLFYYMHPQRLEVRQSDVRIPLGRLSTPVGSAADLLQNGRDELVVGSETNLYVIGYQDDNYQVLHTLTAPGTGFNRGFKALHKNGESYIISSSIGKSDSDAYFGHNFPQYQLITLFKYNSGAFEIADQRVILGRSTEERDMKLMAGNNGPMAVYTNGSQLYVFDVEDDQLVLNHYDDELDTIDTAVLAGNIILTGTEDNTLRITGLDGDRNIISWFQAPVIDDEIQVYGRFRGNADEILLEISETNLSETVAFPTEPGIIHKLASFPAANVNDNFELKLSVLQNGDVLTDVMRTFESGPGFSVADVLAGNERLTVFTDKPHSYSLSDFQLIMDYLPSGYRLQAVLPNSPLSTTFVFNKNLPEELDVQFGFLRNGSYQNPKNAEQTFQVMNEGRDAEVFYIRNHEIQSENTLRMEMNKPVDEASVSDAQFVMSPRGNVAQVNINGNELEISVEGTVLRGSGISQMLTINGLKATDGSSIATDYGNQIELLDIPSDITNVRVYPNPWNTNQTEVLTFANIPQGAVIRIYTVDGRFVRELTVDNPNGGLMWDGRTRAGNRPGSGVYLYQVHYEDLKTIFDKIVIVR